MTKLKFWYMKLNPTAKNVFRDAILKNTTGIKVSVSSFFRFLGEQQAPVPIQKLMAKLSGLSVNELYDAA